MTTKLRASVERRIRELPPGRRLRQELALKAIERFGDRRTLRVLDAGCGEGLFATALGRRHPDWRIDAVDLDEAALERARLLADENGVDNVAFSRRDITQPLGEGLYDAVAALECLAEIPDDRSAVRALARSLRPGGLLIAHVPERAWKPVLRGSRPTWSHEVRHGYGRQELEDLLAEAGLEAERIVGTTRGTLQLAEEARERVKGASLKRRALAYPLMRLAVRLERAGLTWGAARAFFLQARRPREALDEPVPGARA